MYSPKTRPIAERAEHPGHFRRPPGLAWVSQSRAKGCRVLEVTHSECTCPPRPLPATVLASPGGSPDPSLVTGSVGGQKTLRGPRPAAPTLVGGGSGPGRGRQAGKGSLHRWCLGPAASCEPGRVDVQPPPLGGRGPSLSWGKTWSEGEQRQEPRSAARCPCHTARASHAGATREARTEGPGARSRRGWCEAELALSAVPGLCPFGNS